MTWAGVIAAVDAHLVAAGASLTAPVTIVRQGEPDTVNAPTLAYWYGGDREAETGNTFGKTAVEELLLIRGYWPGSVRAGSLDSSIEVLIQAAKAAVRARLWGDASLGGNAIKLELPPTESGWTLIGTTVCRTFELALWIDLGEVDDITP